MESELPAGGLGEGCHPTLGVPDYQDALAVDVKSTHHQAIGSAEAPVGTILMVLLLILDADAEDLAGISEVSELRPAFHDVVEGLRGIEAGLAEHNDGETSTGIVRMQRPVFGCNVPYCPIPRRGKVIFSWPSPITSPITSLITHYNVPHYVPHYVRITNYFAAAHRWARPTELM